MSQKKPHPDYVAYVLRCAGYKGRNYRRYGKLSLEDSMKACSQAFRKAEKEGIAREALVHAFTEGFEGRA